MSKKLRSDHRKQKEKDEKERRKQAHFRETEERNIARFGHHSMTPNQKKRFAQKGSL
jgi:hypothetical protein